MSAVRPVVLRLALVGGTLALLSACGSKAEPPASEEPAVASAPAPASTARSASTSAADDLGEWVEKLPPSATPASTASVSPADPAAVIERYKRECPAESKTAECRALRSEVESIFLGALLAVRVTNEVIDPAWYRLAAVSETPQLACIGLNELIWFPQRTAEDEAAIVRAIDSPYRGVRGAVVVNAQRIPALSQVVRRSAGLDYRALTGVCIDSARDPVPGTKWAGEYPGVQFRPFASNDSLRWFTTPDPPEKVIAWFAARGKPARTANEMAADAQAHLMEEMNRLSSNPDEDNTQKIMELMMGGQGSPAQWSQPFSNLEGIGEIKYVMIGANQGIAIFRDDLLNATSIVAPKPVKPVDLTNIEAAKEEAEMRSIYGY